MRRAHFKYPYEQEYVNLMLLLDGAPLDPFLLRSENGKARASPAIERFLAHLKKKEREVILPGIVRIARRLRDFGALAAIRGCYCPHHNVHMLQVRMKPLIEKLGQLAVPDERQHEWIAGLCYAHSGADLNFAATLALTILAMQSPPCPWFDGGHFATLLNRALYDRPLIRNGLRN